MNSIYWLTAILFYLFQMGNPWEIVRNDVSYPVKFFGKVTKGLDGKTQWVGGQDIVATAYDVPIPGYKTRTTINLRLWSTKVPSQEFDLAAFNAGDHPKATLALKEAEKVCTLRVMSSSSIIYGVFWITEVHSDNDRFSNFE